MIFLILFWMKLHNFLQTTDMKKSHKPKCLRVIQIYDNNVNKFDCYLLYMESDTFMYLRQQQN